MARHFFLLTLALALATLPVAIHAQETSPSPTPTAPPSHSPHSGEGRNLHDSRFKEFRQSIEKMPEGQRQKAFEKFRKWQQMPGDEQAHFRFMQGERDKRAQKAVDDAIKAGGLTLDDVQKQKFTEIYKRERRKLEEQLRAEMDQRRQERLPDLQKSIGGSLPKRSCLPQSDAEPLAQRDTVIVFSLQAADGNVMSIFLG